MYLFRVNVCVYVVPFLFQITLGSMWYQQQEEDPADTKPFEKFMVKWSGMSYLHVSWETMGDLIELANPAVKMQVCCTFLTYVNKPDFVTLATGSARGGGGIVRFYSYWTVWYKY